MAVLTGLSPNTESDDIWRAIRVLCAPWTWRKRKHVAKIEDELETILQPTPHNLPPRNVVATSSGRAALYYLFQALDIGQGDEVIVQAFTCISVPGPVTWTGATPVFADIDPHTYNLDPKSVAARITPRTKAVLVQHTFGIPAPLTELRQLAQQHNLVLIEDCAHALGRTYEGKPLGTFGDAAILSFGRDKIVSSVFGGAIVTDRDDLAQKLQAQQDTLPLPPRWWIAQQLFHPLLLSVAKRLYFTASLGKAKLWAWQKLGLLSKAVTLDERAGHKPAHVSWRYSPALAQLLNQQLEKLTTYNRRRQEHVARYKAAFTETASPSVPPAPLLRFPIRHPDRDRVLDQAKQHRLLLGDWYRLPIFPCDDCAATISYTPGSCPQAEAAAKEVINLPTAPTLTPKEQERVISFMKRAHGTS